MVVALVIVSVLLSFALAFIGFQCVYGYKGRKAASVHAKADSDAVLKYNRQNVELAGLKLERDALSNKVAGLNAQREALTTERGAQNDKLTELTRAGLDLVGQLELAKKDLAGLNAELVTARERALNAEQWIEGTKTTIGEQSHKITELEAELAKTQQLLTPKPVKKCPTKKPKR